MAGRDKQPTERTPLVGRAEADVAGTARRAEADVVGGARRAEADVVGGARRAEADVVGGARRAEADVKDVEKGVKKEFKAVEKIFSGYEKFFMKHKNKKFAEDAEIAVRAAVFILVMSIPFFLPRRDIEARLPTFYYFMDQGWYDKYVIACFLFCYYRDLANTVSLAVSTIVGVYLAVLGIWVMFGVYPEGITHEASSQLYWICFAYGALYTWIILWLNLPLNSIIFSLASFVWFYMAFMNPNVGTKNFAKNFEIDLTGSATKELLNAGLGAFLAVLAMCIPKPLLASQKALDESFSVINTVLRAWKDLTNFACAESAEEMNEFEEAGMKRNLRDIFSAVGSIRGNLDVSWWECLGMGKIQQQRIMLYSLEGVLSESYDRLLSVFSVALQDREPSELTQTCENWILSLLDEVGVLLSMGLAGVVDGSISASERNDIMGQVQVVRQKVTELTVNFRQTKAAMRPKPSVLDSNLFAEHAFALTVCSFASGCAAWGQSLAMGELKASYEGGFLGLGCLKGIFDPGYLYDSEHLTWTIKSWISLCVSFYVGYVGVISWVGPNSDIRGFHLTNPYNAAITSTMCVLLSKSISTGISKNLGRLQGVILGTAVGVKLYTIFATECSWAGMGMLSVSVFLWMCFTMFLYHNSDVNSYLAFLLCYCGTMNMVARCGMTGGLAIGNTVMDLLMTIVIIASMDMMFAKDTAAHMAHKAFMDVYQNIRQSIQDLFDPNVPQIKFTPGKIMGSISLASTLGGLAEAEARWHRTPWRTKTFNAAIESATRTRYILTGMKCAAAGGSVTVNKPDTLLCLTNLRDASGNSIWEPLAKRPAQKMAQVERLLSILLHETEGSCHEFEKTEKEIRESTSRMIPKLTQAVVDAANANEMLRKESHEDSLELDPAARQSYILGAIRALIEETRVLQSQIILEG